MDLLSSEKNHSCIRHPTVAGIDEVGRGCLAGPVFAAAVILDPLRPVPGLRDSKKLSASRRESLDGMIRERALAWALGRAEVDEIDSVNILQASFLAMRRAFAALGAPVERCRVDGNQNPGLPVATDLIVGGDGTEPSIMAASIIAKVARDSEMETLDRRYPGYGFARNKGYGTPEHLAGLSALGPCAGHRMSFAPCQRARQPLSRVLP